MLKRLVIILLFLIQCAINSYLYSEVQDYKFNRLGVEDGLSQITVSDICQDEKSRIWIATLDGLNCYDGNYIKVFNHFHTDSISYGNLYVTQMIEDGCGSLFLLTASGLFQFNLDTEGYKLLPFATPPSAIAVSKHGIWVACGKNLYMYDKSARKLQSRFNDIKFPQLGTTMVEGSDESLWITTATGGVTRINPRGIATKLLENIEVLKIINGKDKNIWLGTNGSGVYCFSANGILLHHYTNEETSRNNSDDLARALCQDSEGNIWVGYRSGLSKIEVATGKIYHYDANTNQIGSLSNRSITSLFTDNQGTVWIGTYWGGVNYFSPEYQHYASFKASPDGLSFPVVGAMAEDKIGNIWICTEGGGLDLYQPDKNRFSHFNKQSGCTFSTDFLKDIVYDSSNDCLWIAADFSNSINRFHPSNHKNEIYSLESLGKENIGDAIFALADTPDKLFIGTTSAIVCFDKHTLKPKILFHQKELFTHNYNMLLLDSRRRLWFASNDGCVAYSIDDDKFHTYDIELELNVNSKKELINVIYEDSSGDIWVGTHGYGLFQLNSSNQIFQLHTPSGLLSGENIRVLCEAPSGNLLIGTGHGLSMLGKADGTITNFNSYTGFPLNMVNRKSMHVSCDNNIYIGGATGLILLQESNLYNQPKVYDLQFSHLYINNKEVSIGDSTGILKKNIAYTTEIKLNHQQKIFAISLFTDNFLHISDGDIEYRLIGYNDNWNVIRSSNDVTYTNISPGKYTFEARLKNFPDIKRTLNITITPPFYATWWAYLLYFCIIATILFFVVKEYKVRLFLKTSLDFEHREKQYIEEVNQSKLRFFTNISHEIRTPITLISGQIDLLLNSGKLSTYVYSKLLNIHKNADNLKSLITELLDFRKQEQGYLKLNIVQFDICALINEHYVLFQELASGRNINLSIQSNCNQCLIWGDKMQIHKVINNLMSNAFKYTPDGGNIVISIHESDTDCTFSVTDNGIGISTDDIYRIFERFYQAENIGQYGGSGIGLALCHGIVKAHHGDITVESQLGKGSCFKVTLKKGDAHFDSSIARVDNNHDKEYIYNPEDKNALNDEIESYTTEIGDNKYKLLIVDDNEEIRNILTEIFSPLYIIDTACDGTEGYAKVAAFQPDLVISDIMMPGMPGTELCAKIKHNIETCHIPVVLLTALGAPERELEGLRIGADIYVVKPFNMRRLVMQCHNLINTRRILQDKYAHQLDVSAKKIATNELDQKFIERATQIVEDNLENTEFDIESFSREMGVGRTVLFQKIKGITGNTPNNFIMNIRLKHAASYLLNEPNMNISEISYRLGFGNPQYFYKCFKELFGVPPTQFRKAYEAT